MAGGRLKGRPGPELLGPVVGLLMARLGYRKRAPALFAMAAWREAVGEAVARHATPERVERDTLHVVVDGAPWANELRWMEGSLVARLNAACGRQAVAHLRFRIGTLPPRPEEVSAWKAPPRPDAAAHAAAARLSDGLAPELATAWQRLVARGLMRSPSAATEMEEDDA